MISDAQLTHNGLTQSGTGSVLVIACGALAREILDIQRRNGLDHITLQCLPAIWHLSPEKIAPAVRELHAANREKYDKIFLAYADCGTGGGLGALCLELGIEMIEGPHCYSFFEGNAAFAEKAGDEITAFYLTDFLARQFEAFVWRPMGLDKHPELIQMYFGNYERLIYQSQCEDPALLARAKTYADRLGLAFEHRHTGYGDLETALRDMSR